MFAWTRTALAPHNRRIGLPTLLLLLLLSLSTVQGMPGHADGTGTGDLMAQIPSIGEHDLKSGDIYQRNNSCGVAAATMILDYYLPQTDPNVHAAISLDAVAKTSDAGPGYVRVENDGTNTTQLTDGLKQAGPALDGVALTATLRTTDQDHWFPVLKAELDAKLPVIVFLADGGLINAGKFHYGHFIVASGYTADDSIIYHEPYDGTIHDGTAHPTIPNAEFGKDWGASLQTKAGVNTPWNYVEVLPPGVSSPVATTGSTLSTVTPSPVLATPQLAYIGADGNIWLKVVPDGVAHHLTSDAAANSVAYSGLMWSPDGTLLATLRGTGVSYNPTAAELLVLRPDGTLSLQVSLPSVPQNRPFVWSPDGRLIAYRSQPLGANPQTGNPLANLILLDSRSGRQVNAVPFDEGPHECGSGYDSFFNATNLVRDAYEGIDAFSWSSDQRSILVSYNCAHSKSALVDLTTGAERTGFPEGASFQPHGSQILGVVAHSLVVLDSAGILVRTLVTVSSESAPFPGDYINPLGQAAWSPDGQTIYYERDDGIWQVGVDGSSDREVVAGTPLDSQYRATVNMRPLVSADGRMLLYLQLQGVDTPDIRLDPAVQGMWVVSNADGSAAVPLLSRTIDLAPSAQMQPDAAWRPSS